MAEQALSATAPAAPKPKAETRREASSLVPRLITGAVILGLWESVVRGFAPGYVAKPSSIVLAIPRVIVDFPAAFGPRTRSTAPALPKGTFRSSKQPHGSSRSSSSRRPLTVSHP